MGIQLLGACSWLAAAGTCGVCHFVEITEPVRLAVLARPDQADLAPIDGSPIPGTLDNTFRLYLCGLEFQLK